MKEFRINTPYSQIMNAEPEVGENEGENNEPQEQTRKRRQKPRRQNIRKWTVWKYRKTPKKCACSCVSPENRTNRRARF